MLNREDWYMIKEMRSKGCYLKDIASKKEKRKAGLITRPTDKPESIEPEGGN